MSIHDVQVVVTVRVEANDPQQAGVKAEGVLIGMMPTYTLGHEVVRNISWKTAKPPLGPRRILS